jgi:SecD/SecF fusion protein
MNLNINRKNIYKGLILLGALLFGYIELKQPINYGLDLKGGVSILLDAQTDDGRRINSSDIENLTEVIGRRIDSIGVTEPSIRAIGSNKVLVEIAGIYDADEAIDVIGKTAFLEFKIKENNGLLGEALITGKDLKKAEVTYINGLPAVSLIFTNEGAKKFYQVTKNNISRQLAIVLDNEVQSSPRISTAIADGKAVISSDNGFSFEEAKKLSLLLNAGSLPLKVSVEEVKIVSATLGINALNGSLTAGLIAFICVMAFMTLWYSLAGLIASISLAIFGVMTLAIMNFLNATMTLPGIAGFILSLGMAVDANVIIFEVIKENLLNGKTISSAIDNGFSKSISSIADSNVTTLIITFILFVLGSGPIKGYSVTLSVGILVSMFSAIFVTKFILNLAVDYLHLKNKNIFGFFNFNFSFNTMDKSKIIFGISILGLLFSLYSISTIGLNYGIDFTGGNTVSLKFNSDIDVNKIDDLVNSFGDIKSQTQVAQDDFGNNNTLILKTSHLSLEKKNNLYSYIRRACGNFEIVSEENIGPMFGSALKFKSILALVIGCFMIIIYISLRFRFTFALAAVIALIHDILIAIGFASFFNYEINSTFIVAILTILGYSINDTVVVFDRIRDNIKLFSSIKETINISINQVFIRSLNTSLTTLISIISLLYVGIESLTPFLMTLLFGIVAGTYSSIFLASPIVYLLEKKR